MNKIPVKGVKHIVAIASGKGGVGKSTVASSLALALSAEGQKVGLLDADIYGPSQGLMMGVPDTTKPEVDNDRLVPLLVNGIQCMSMSFVSTAKTPMVWRGPMASGALQQLMEQTAWVNLDYLIVDMPPGTGDIHLTLSQRHVIAGAVIVTTPQKIALLDAVRGIEMFRKVEIPVLGIIENMSLHICSECGHKEAIFGSGGGERLASDYETPLLGMLPLSDSLRDQADGGESPLVADPESDISQLFRSIARELMDEVGKLGTSDLSIPAINIDE